MKRQVLALLLFAVLAASFTLSACGRESEQPTAEATTTPTRIPVATATVVPTPTATATPTPAPADAQVILPDQPAEGYVLTDPSFPALEGAKAFFGQLGGTIYRIEIPNNWNRRLVLWAHGFREFIPDLRADAPPLRQHLIENGYAWAASSYSANGFVPYQGAHETAALYDFFVRQFGRPEYTYITGASMGGNVVLLSLELFPNRYDGALAACSATSLGILDFFGHYVVLAAYAVGVTQEEYDTAHSLAQLINERILPALEADPQARALFESLVATISGGPRPFRHQGFEQFFSLNFALASLGSEIAPQLMGAFDNTEFVYPADPGSGISADELNARVIRIAGDPQIRNVEPNLSHLRGAVPIPLLMIHTTGDGWVPFSNMQQFRRLADATGNGDLLVQRAIRAPDHCGFSQQELERAFQDLVNWVEMGLKPAGEDVLGPLQDIGLEFTDPIRPGDPGGL